MKNYYTIIFFLFISYISIAQEEYCGTEINQKTLSYFDKIKNKVEILEKQFLLKNKNRKAPNNLISVPIKAHIIRTSNGTGGLTPTQLNDALSIVNNFYVNAGLEFFLCDGINYIDSDKFYNFNTIDEEEMLAGNSIENIINIYFANSVTKSNTALCGYASFPGGLERILISNSCTTNGSTLSHEIAHFFGIYHTHGTSNSIRTSELVDGSNCLTTGDLFCDTPADPQLNSTNVNSDCVYIGDETDINGDFYTPNTRNIMSYSRKSCRTEFSNQQYARINAVYHASRSNLECSSFNANFSADITETCNKSYLTVNFKDNSAGASSWSWDVNNDGIEDYNIQNPSHTYTTKNEYDVSLKISNGTRVLTKTKKNFIKVGGKEINTTSIILSITFDNYPSEISWQFLDENDNIIASGEDYSTSNYPNKTIEETFSVSLNKCYKFEIYDSFGDGLCCGGGNGSFNLKTTDGELIVSKSDFGSKASENLYIGTILNIEDINKNGIILYPNPASSKINIINIDNILPNSYAIFNTLGQKVLAKKINDSSDLNIDILNLESGVYFLRIEKNNYSNNYSFIKE